MVAPALILDGMNIPEWLRGMLKERRYRSTYDMSLQWGIPEPTISRWLTGQRRPSVSYCIKLSQVTGRSVEDVVRMADEDVRTVDITS